MRTTQRVLDDALGLRRGASDVESLKTLVQTWAAAVTVFLRTVANTWAENTMPDLLHVRAGGAGGLHADGEQLADPRVELLVAAERLVDARGLALTEAITAARDVDPDLDQRVVQHYLQG